MLKFESLYFPLLPASNHPTNSFWRSGCISPPTRSAQPKPPPPPAGTYAAAPAASSRPGKSFTDFMSQTDDDWDADLGDETTDDFLQRKMTAGSRPSPVGSKLGGDGSGSELPSRGPSYPSPRRKDTQGLKPQFESIIQGKPRSLSLPPSIRRQRTDSSVY